MWNEPSSNTEEEEGGDLAYWKKYRPYWRVLTDAIRASGNKNVVLVAPPLWAFNLRSLRESLLPDEQTGYVWHVYPGNYPEELVDTLDDLLLHGSMSQEMRQTIEQAVAAVAPTNALKRVRTAAYLILTSSQYQVER